MPIQLQVRGDPRAGHRLLIDGPTAQDAVGQVVMNLRRPTTWERFGRAACNFFTLGWYTRNQNRQQWAQFQTCVVQSAPELAQRPGADVQLAQVFSTYADKRLTRSRAANVLAEVDRVRHGLVPQPRAPRMLDASGHVLARGWRTMAQRCGPQGQQVRDLRAYAQALSDSPDQPRGGDASRALLSILRPGQAMSSSAIEMGQQALKAYAQNTGVVFGSCSMSNELHRHLPGLAQSPQWRELLARSDAHRDTRALFVVPLALSGASARWLHENHSVLLAMDPASRKIMYLDAKADSMDHASEVYGNVASVDPRSGRPAGGDLESAVHQLGARLFGPDWTPQTGVLRLTLAKQQGANDCGAFTHTFTRWLIEGKSLGDIERSFTADDRAAMRIQMAEDIRRHVIGDARPLAQALAEGGASAPSMQGTQALSAGQAAADDFESVDLPKSVNPGAEAEGFFDLRRK